MTRDTDYLLARLQRLRRVRRDYVADLNPLGIQLVERSIRATVGDLQDFGRAEEAAAELHKLAVDLAAGGSL